MKINVVKAEDCYIQEAVKLFSSEYEEACYSNPILPKCENLDFIKEQITELFHHGLGFVALIENTEALQDIKNLCLLDAEHFKSAPIFMTGREDTIETIMKEFEEWMAEDNRHLWIAYEGE